MLVFVGVSVSKAMGKLPGLSAGWAGEQRPAVNRDVIGSVWSGGQGEVGGRTACMGHLGNEQGTGDGVACDAGLAGAIQAGRRCRWGQKTPRSRVRGGRDGQDDSARAGL